MKIDIYNELFLVLSQAIPKLFIYSYVQVELFPYLF